MLFGGCDGVVINDFAQTDEGNMPHLSYGLTLTGQSKVEWASLPARRRPISEAWSGRKVTPEVLEWASNVLDTGFSPAAP